MTKCSGIIIWQKMPSQILLLNSIMNFYKTILFIKYNVHLFALHLECMYIYIWDIAVFLFPNAFFCSMFLSSAEVFFDYISTITGADYFTLWILLHFLFESQFSIIYFLILNAISLFLIIRIEIKSTVSQTFTQY